MYSKAVNTKNGCCLTVCKCGCTGQPLRVKCFQRIYKSGSPLLLSEILQVDYDEYRKVESLGPHSRKFHIISPLSPAYTPPNTLQLYLFCVSGMSFVQAGFAFKTHKGAGYVDNLSLRSMPVLVTAYNIE